MNLTIEQLSKATKLSIPTLRAYTSQRNLGKKVGNKRVYTQADVQKLLKGSKKSLPKKARRAPADKTTKRAFKPEAMRANEPMPTSAPAIPLAAKPVKASFWRRVFGGGKIVKKVRLMDA